MLKQNAIESHLVLIKASKLQDLARWRCKMAEVPINSPEYMEYKELYKDAKEELERARVDKAIQLERARV